MTEVKKPAVFTSRDFWDPSLNKEKILYDALGFPQKIAYKDYLRRYKRQEVAHRIIKAPATATWSDTPEIYDNTKTEGPEGKVNRSTFELAFDLLANELKLFGNLKKLDILASLGRFAILMLGYNSDSVSVLAPVTASDKLVYVKPISEEHVTVLSWDYDPTSERYGWPKIYQIEVATDSEESRTIQVHWSRVIHVAIDTLDEELYGIPAMEPIYNRLIGLDKIAGSAPEGYLLGARGGFVCKASEHSASLTDDEKKAISNELNLYFEQQKRTLTVDGLDIQELKPQVISPKEQIDVQLRLISAQTNIPVRILTGSERGELASSQDERGWLKYIEQRRNEVAEGSMLTPLVEKLIFNGTLPEPVGGFYFTWKPLLVLTDKEKAEIAELNIKVLDTYASNPTAMAIYPPEFFFRDFFGKTNEEILEMEQASNLVDDDAFLDEDLKEYPDEIEEQKNSKEGTKKVDRP